MTTEVPLPHQSLAVVGHDAAKKQIEEAFDSGRMHHAWLITGEQGIGKATLATHIAHMILSDGANRFGRFNPDHPAARLIAAQAHPDLIVLSRPLDEKTGAAKDSIPVDEARKLGPFLSMTASQGRGRVAIIDEAHALNRNGQNAILKMIEEPPTGATVILTATTVGALLPTIRSRCRVLKLEPLPPVQLGVVLARLGVELEPPLTVEKLHQMAGGSVGAALRLIQSEAMPLLDECAALLAAMPTLDLVRVHKLAERIGRKEEGESFAVVTGFVCDSLRHAVRAAALNGPQGAGQGGDPLGLAAKLASSGRLDKALDIWENTKDTFATAQNANLDRKLAVLNAFSDISRMMAT